MNDEMREKQTNSPIARKSNRWILRKQLTLWASDTGQAAGQLGTPVSAPQLGERLSASESFSFSCKIFNYMDKAHLY